MVDAVVDLLAGEGVGAVTASRIATETGVARTTIYRHWPETSHLILETIEAVVDPHGTTCHTGDLEADLTTVIQNLAARITKRQFRPIFAALLDGANHDPLFVEAQRSLVNGVLQPVREVLSEASKRGDLPPDLDVETACAELVGPVFHQYVMLQTRIETELITRAVRRFLATSPCGATTDS